MTQLGGDGYFISYDLLDEDDTFTKPTEIKFGNNVLTLNYSATGAFIGSSDDELLDVVLASVGLTSLDELAAGEIQASEAKSLLPSAQTLQLWDVWSRIGEIAIKPNKDYDQLAQDKQLKLLNFQENLLKATALTDNFMGYKQNRELLKEIVEISNIYSQIDPQIEEADEKTFLTALWQGSSNSFLNQAVADLKVSFDAIEGNEAKLIAVQKELLKEVLQYETSNNVQVNSIIVDLLIKSTNNSFNEKISDETITKDKFFEKAWNEVNDLRFDPNVRFAPYPTDASARYFIRSLSSQIIDAGNAFGLPPELIAAVLHHEIYNAGIEDLFQNLYADDIIFLEGAPEAQAAQFIADFSRRSSIDLVSFGIAQFTPGTLKQVVEDGARSLPDDPGLPYDVGPTLTTIRPSDWETDAVDAQLRLILDDSKAPLLIAARLAQIYNAWDQAGVNLIDRFGEEYAYGVLATLYPIGIANTNENGNGINPNPGHSDRGLEAIDLLPHMRELLQN